MLDAEEVKQILEQFEKLKHKNKSKKTEDNVRKQQLQAKESSPGFPLFV